MERECLIPLQKQLQKQENAATTVMPLLPMALYLAQFFTPMITTTVYTLIGIPDLSSYYMALGSSLLLLFCSSRIRYQPKNKNAAQQRRFAPRMPYGFTLVRSAAETSFL